jgi:hypothetical protein
VFFIDLSHLESPPCVKTTIVSVPVTALPSLRSDKELPSAVPFCAQCEKKRLFKTLLGEKDLEARNLQVIEEPSCRLSGEPE